MPRDQQGVPTSVGFAVGWARSSGILGAVGSWLCGRHTADDEQLCPGAPGPVYGRRDSEVFEYSQLHAQIHGGTLFHVSVEAAAVAGLQLSAASLGAAIDAGAVLVCEKAATQNVLIPSIDPVTRRPSLVLTVMEVPSRGPTPIHEQAPALLHPRIAPLSTARANFRAAVLEALTELSSVNVRIDDVATDATAELPTLPRAVEPELIAQLESVLQFLTAIDRARSLLTTAAAGQARQERVAERLRPTSDVHTCARAYVDALWHEVFTQSGSG